VVEVVFVISGCGEEDCESGHPVRGFFRRLVSGPARQTCSHSAGAESRRSACTVPCTRALDGDLLPAFGV